ncbi:MAG TPA: C25 family cysteine peptidase, partial [Cytophagaceae bacterium]|nr:C25 family cysteine peptidase [Cytophagaceae bacterium]
MAQAQYGNEWIVPSQTYYKIQTAKDGMYAIPYNSQLQFVNGAPTANLQLWHRGIEQKITVRDNGNGTFDTGDSIIFFGQKNDGTLDTKLYTPTTSQPHKYYNLYNDTTAYFLTWGPSTTGQRIASDLTNTVVTAETFHMAQILKVVTDDYSQGWEYGENKQTYGDVGETWCSNKFNQNSPYVFDTLLSDVNPDPGATFTVEAMVVGRNASYNRSVSVTISNPNSLNQVDYFPLFSIFSTALFTKSYPASLLTSPNLTITITALDGSVIPVQTNYISVAYIKITYPQNTQMGGVTSKFFYPANSSSQTYDNITWSSSSTPLAFDLTDKNNLTALNTTLSGTNLGVFVPAGVTQFEVIQSDAYLTVPSIKLADLNPYASATNYTSADFVILTHQKFMTGAETYADYRRTTGGGHNVLVVDVDKIYDQYSYGEFSPTGIMGFCNYQADNNTHIKDLFIIGKGLDLIYAGNGGFYRKNPSYYINNSDPTLRTQNFVPTAGSPPSDILYSMTNTSGQYIPRFAVGRLSVRADSTIGHYLDKVKSHETLDSNLLWRKQLIHLSGGNGASQISQFRIYV